MLDTLQLYQELKAHLPPEAAEKIAQILGQVYGELRQSLTKQDLDEVRESLDRLRETQAQVMDHLFRIDQRLDGLTSTVKELAESQKRSEAEIARLAQNMAHMDERLIRVENVTVKLHQDVEDLKQKFGALSQEVEDLKQKFGALSKDVEVLKQDVAGLKQDVGILQGDVKDLRKEVGGLSNTVGYGLENQIIPYMPLFVSDEYGMKAEKVERRFVPCEGGRYEEVNIYVEGASKEGQCFLIGECKAQPGKKDADRFAKKLQHLSKVLRGSFHPVFVGHSWDPHVEAYFRETYPEIRLLRSYELALRYGLLWDGWERLKN